jgi:hypothetical protein
LTHEEAIRDLIVSVLISPKFCYRLDLGDAASLSSAKAPGKQQPTYQPLSNSSLASRLSYFLWSSSPDEELLATGNLQKRAVLIAQVRRMLKDPRARGLALEFGGNWLDFRRFQEHNAVDRERFPEFTNNLREAMFQEPVHVLEDIIRRDRSVLDLIYGDYTFVNPVLAKHYGMPEPAGGENSWVRTRKPVYNGRVSDAERSRIANQSGEARLLGSAARAGRDHSATTSFGSRAAQGRGGNGSTLARNAGQTPG